MAIKQLPPSQGILGSKALGVGLGFATGGPAGAALALASENNPAISKIAKLGGMAGSGGSATSEVAEGSTNPVSDTLQSPNIGDGFRQDQSPMGRRLSLSTVDDPKRIIQDGLDALWHADVSPEMRADIAVPLLQAKHYGKEGV